ncbi:hypothetical protein [Leptospira interrogans]|nr:hypothetical protein [Leptospira interrogans]UML83008.1 hypothetical protein FH587_03405 [Leptospira interrogans]WOT13262.1 hypothetical protein CFY92_0020970 [Leptospira interrogans]
MKLRILILIVCLCVNCYIGTQRDTCRYNLKESGKSFYCDLTVLGFHFKSGTNDLNTIQRIDTANNYLILECLDYYERLKECDKEENRYIPSIYGINFQPMSAKKSELFSMRF